MPSARLQSWDYANEGMYFITICTGNRDCYFGQIVCSVETPCMASQNNPVTPYQMQLSDIGKIAAEEWVKTIELRPDMNLELGEYVVMPNHVHGIIMIGENQHNDGGGNGSRDAMHRVSTTRTDPEPSNKFGPQRKNIGSIMRGYKSAVTTWARKNDVPFAWQTRFHDHIIRSAEEYERISDYIRNNPAKWGEDRFYNPSRPS